MVNSMLGEKLLRWSKDDMETIMGGNDEGVI
jgi:hypothetical protein